MHLLGIAQSLGLFLVVCLTTAAALSLAMVALARMERATVAARHPDRHPDWGRERLNAASRASERVSSAGSCTYRPPGR